MQELIAPILKDAEINMKKAIEHLEAELLKVRAGKANPAMLEGILVDYYGTMTPLNQVASVNTPDARTIAIQPWEKTMLQPIEKAILAANIGFNPQDDGTIVRINVPPLTEDRRKELVKKAKSEGEHAKVSIRNIRRDANEHIKKLVKDGLAEDLSKNAENEVQQKTDAYIVLVDKHMETKEQEIMTV